MKKSYAILFALTTVLYGLLPYALLRHWGGLVVLLFWVSSALLWIIFSLIVLEKEFKGV
ncbi:MAG: hypothetical protein N3E36_00930 [Sulfolobales archaeon]|nr:hypothetical protein [Sulfolobales archaeon]